MLGAVGHGRHGLRPADGEDTVDAAQIGGIEDFGGYRAVGARGGAEDDLPAAGDAGRDGQHQHRGEERRLAARDVKAHAADRHGALHAPDARHRLDVDLGRQLGAVEGLDVRFRGGEGLFQRGGDERGGCGAHVGRNFERPGIAPLDAAGDSRAASGRRRILRRRGFRSPVA